MENPNTIYQPHAAFPSRCPVCRTPVAKSGDYCCRECALQQQRKCYGNGVYTIRELLSRERTARKVGAA